MGTEISTRGAAPDFLGGQITDGDFGVESSVG